MGVDVLEQVSSDGSSQVDLAVRLDDQMLVVSAGSFRIMGVDHRLDEDQECEFRRDPEVDMDVFGYLVFMEDGGVAVLVDEVLRDGKDLPFFATGVGGYHPLYLLFTFVVPAGGADDLDVKVFRLVKGGE